jgi:putative transposase
MKKKLDCSVREKVGLIEPKHPQISLSRQAEFFGISRASLSDTPVLDKRDMLLKRRIDEIYTEAPGYGSRTINAAVQRRGQVVGLEQVHALMREMGLEASVPKPSGSLRHPEHRVSPSLLRGVTISRPNQVWATDITYSRRAQGWMYLMAILDWFSRYVVAWAVSTTQAGGGWRR